MRTRKLALFILILSCCWFYHAGAATLPLRADLQSTKPEINLITQTEDLIQIEVLLPEVEFSEVTLAGKRWDRVAIPGGGWESDLGAPELPNFSTMLAIPPRSGVRAEFEPLETATIPNVELMPAQGQEPEDLLADPQPVQFDMAAYGLDAFYAKDEVAVSEPALIRGLRVAAIKTNPISYNPTTKELRIAHRYRVNIHFEGTDLRNVPQRPTRPMSQAWAKVLRSQIANFDELDVEETALGSYLIICVNDTGLVNNILAPLVDWKRRKGHTVVVQTVAAGASTTTIKSVIQNAYDNWEIPPEYVLLFGDTSGNYSLAAWDYYGVDHQYSQLDGSDILADVSIGRLPATFTTDAIAMIAKVLYYEKIPLLSNTNWYHQAVLLAGSSSSGLSTIQVNRWIKTRLIEHEYTHIDTFWYSMGGGSVVTTLTNAINNGVTYANYRGYLGMSGWSNGNTDALTNGRKLPFITTITCGTGGFSGSESLMEHFVKVGTAATPKGAVACIGTATSGTHTRFNNTIDYGIYAGILDEGITQAGNALVRGKLELYITYQSHDPGSVSSFSNWNNLAGDPGLELYTGPIQYLSCDVPTTINWGVNTLTLTVNETGVGPLEGATVCFYKSQQLQSVGLTDENGQVTLPLNADTTGNVKVTITKQNFSPVVDSLDVMQEDVVVGYLSNNIDDDNNGSSSGDGDLIINPNETVEIPLIFKNFGSTTTATGISVTASENDYYATLLDSVETFPNLAPGASGNSLDDFDVQIAPNCPNGHIVHLNLVTTANQGSWSGLLELEVISYDMTVLSARAAGTDTLLSPGETADFLLTILNVGDKNAIALTASIASLDTLVTVNDNRASFGTVNPGQMATCNSNPFNLTAHVNTPQGHHAHLGVTFLSSTGATQTDTITIQLGAKLSTDPQGPDEYGYYCFDNTDISYTQRPVYNWVEIDPNFGGLGTQLPINDPSENQDASTNVPLPFTFRYYGAAVDRITVCSNGWISTVANNSFTDFRNYPIPSSPGPNGMIAPFWDDLVTTGTGHVFAYDDAINHRFIVEWSRLPNLGSMSTIETFEVILYDPTHYPTQTGDGEILFQYNTITEVNGPYDDNPYSTVGIERPDQQDGIEVVYWNTYADIAAAHLQNSRAYLFTTDFEMGSGPPIINVSPASLIINVPQGGVGSSALTISNQGATLLQFQAGFTYGLEGQPYVIPGTPPGVDATGGPDNFGYTWIDSDEPGGPTYSWVDISQVGTPITFAHNDSTTPAMPLGFEFPLYGETFSSYILSANGWLSFTSHAPAWNNTTLPNVQAPFDLIAAFWDDLDPLATGAQTLIWNNGSDSLVVSYINVAHFGTAIGTYTFQMILTVDGAITCQYQTLTGVYISCTVGIQNGDGSDGLTVCYNQPYLHNNLAVRFYDPLFRALPDSGLVLPGRDTNVNIVAYAYGMQQGTYNAVLGLDSNDPLTPHLDIPITLHVGNQPGAPLLLTITPNNPPIVIPVNGGSFSYHGILHNASAGTQVFDFWTMVTLPDGLPYGPTIYRDNITLYSGMTLSRTLNQFVPGNAPAGQYHFSVNVGQYPDTVIATDGFSFSKAASMSFGAGADNWMVSGWDEATEQIPVQFAFKGCKPNPFNPTTEVLFDLPQTAKVIIKIYDVMGRQVAALQDGLLEAGSHTVRWDASVAASGVYFLHFQSGNINTSQKLLLVK